MLGNRPASQVCGMDPVNTSRKRQVGVIVTNLADSSPSGSSPTLTTRLATSGILRFTRLFPGLDTSVVTDAVAGGVYEQFARIDAHDPCRLGSR